MDRSKKIKKSRKVWSEPRNTPADPLEAVVSDPDDFLQGQEAEMLGEAKEELMMMDLNGECARVAMHEHGLESLVRQGMGVRHWQKSMPTS